MTGYINYSMYLKSHILFINVTGGSILLFPLNLIICLFCFQFVIFGPLEFVISLFKLNRYSLRGNFYSFNNILESFLNF